MGLAAIFLLIAVLSAGWLVTQAARGVGAGGVGEGGEGRMMTILKIVIWLGLAAVLFAARLWPLAFMVLLAAVAVTAIEQWRARTVQLRENANPVAPAPRREMTAEEAASILGVPVDADAGAVRAAHRKLIGQIHPDKGGTDYLAAKINEARDFLLARGAAGG